MRFGYTYKTAEGIRHEDICEAKSKEAVFSELRTKGIKPIKVWEIHSRFYVSRRTCAIIILALALNGTLFYAYILHSNLQTAMQAESAALPRHQIYGDPVLLEEIERDNYSSVFPAEGDRILAAYAIPGRPVTNLPRLPYRELIRALEKCSMVDIVVLPGETTEASELKRIVQGMKEELRWYIADGEGTVATYLRRLNERQEEEIRIYERTKKELESVSDPSIRVERNAALRAMGLRTIPRPQKDR